MHTSLAPSLALLGFGARLICAIMFALYLPNAKYHTKLFAYYLLVLPTTYRRVLLRPAAGLSSDLRQVSHATYRRVL